MKATRFLQFIAVALLVCPLLGADGPAKYKTWPKSPAGYYMTAAERAEWKNNVKSDADAEKFIAEFLAKRPPGFQVQVDRAAEMADKHLSVEKTKGSLTTRGKIVILLGPPASFSIARRDIKGIPSGTAEGASMAGAGSMSERGPQVGEMVSASMRSNLTARTVNEYTFVYKGDTLPGKQSKDLSIVVEVNPLDGTDQITDRKAAAQLDALFEAAAAASLRK